MVNGIQAILCFILAFKYLLFINAEINHDWRFMSNLKNASIVVDDFNIHTKTHNIDSYNHIEHLSHGDHHWHDNTSRDRRLGASDEMVLGCGLIEPTTEEVKADKERMAHWYRKQSQESIANRITTTSYIIPVYFHVLRPNRWSGQVSMATILSYIRTLNSEFRKTPFKFTLKDVTFTFNSNWTDNCEKEVSIKFKKKLRRGSAESLNVYICRKAGGVAGYSYLPGPGSNNFVGDGVVIVRNSMTQSYSSIILVHEVGHFLGLQHTFNGDSCDESNEGDWVDDTPQHLNRASDVNCRTSFRDTCPTRPGKDPVNNFMTYSQYITCLREFTTGQVERMTAQYELYRLPPTPSSDAPTSATLPPTVMTPSCKKFGNRCYANSDCCNRRCGMFGNLVSRCRLGPLRKLLPSMNIF